MKRRVQTYKVEDLVKIRARISFPEYQREGKLWSVEKKRLLIDSILRDIDIPKLYFNRTQGGDLEVVDGQQRLWSIWEFIDDEYTFEWDSRSQKYSELPTEHKRMIRNYGLQIVEFEDAEDEYLRTLFLRLQLGLLLVTGEKLHAAIGAMKDFVFGKMASHKFILNVKIPKRRFAKETLCAQIAINSFMRAKLQVFARTRYEDLDFFFKEYEQPQGSDLELFRMQTKTILSVLDNLSNCFGEKTQELTSRSYILSVYLLFEDIRDSLNSTESRQKFIKFTFLLWKRLREEIGAGFDRKNRELYVFETMLSSAPGEKYQIERRHHKLAEYYQHFVRIGKIKGEK